MARKYKGLDKYSVDGGVTTGFLNRESENEGIHEQGDASKEDEQVEIQPPSHVEALQAVELVQRYQELQEEATPQCYL